MSLADFKKKYFSSISYRTSIISASLITGIIILVLYLSDIRSFTELAPPAVAAFLVSFIVIYSVSAKLHARRISKLYEIIKSISKKKFIEHPLPPRSHSKDELDVLMYRTVKASEIVSREMARLNKIENYRKEFIGDISHELKTPIFAIQGFIETLLDGAVHDDEVNELFLKKTMRNVNRLIYLTNDLMEISRLETGELKSNFKDVYLRDIVLDVVESLQYKAQKEDIEIRVKDFDKNIQVRADRNQIKQVLINLIENGMKYNTPGGYVEIGISEKGTDPNKLLLYVKDTGVGIDKRDVMRVTERFFRVDKSRSRDKGGTGLGLAIVKHIVEAHGEKLIIDSAPDQGSTFGITLTKAGYFLE
jgi:two-component system phosphate regulon sensor histidine kinase PhoR